MTQTFPHFGSSCFSYHPDGPLENPATFFFEVGNSAGISDKRSNTVVSFNAYLWLQAISNESLAI
jgi:hypothetical protein